MTLGATSCVVCGSDRITAIASAIGDRRYCLDCFHGWRPEAPDYAYEAVAMCPLGTAAERIESQIDFFAPYAKPAAHVLEIGCATGELAAATRARLDIVRYQAIELSPAYALAEPRVDRLHRRPLQALLDRPDPFGAPFDLVLISHVIEHIADPAAELAAIRRVLKDDGALFIEAPNRSGNVTLPIDDNRSHIHFFSPNSLMRLLAQCGFEAVAVATGARLDARYADSLRIVAKPFALPAWRPDALGEHPALASERNLVVWGAGSLVDELLANFLDPGRIDFFIDRNPAKHGASLMGRPVRSPESLGVAPRTVLVNSIDFADAITADINSLYPHAGHRLIRIGDLLEAAGQAPARNACISQEDA